MSEEVNEFVLVFEANMPTSPNKGAKSLNMCTL